MKIEHRRRFPVLALLAFSALPVLAIEQSKADRDDEAAQAGEKTRTSATQPSSPTNRATASSQKRSVRSKRPVGRAESPAAASQPAGAKTYVYTNADLVRHARPEDEPTTPTAASKARADQQAFEWDAQKRLVAQPLKDADRAKVKRDAEERLKAAEGKVEALRRRLLAFNNPFVGLPELPEAEQKERTQMPRDQLVKKTEEQLRVAETELAAARANLAEVGW